MALAWVYKLQLHASAQAQALNTSGFPFNFKNNSNKPSSIDIKGDSAPFLRCEGCMVIPSLLHSAMPMQHFAMGNVSN